MLAVGAACCMVCSPLCWVHSKPRCRPQPVSTAWRVRPSRRPCVLARAGQRVPLVPLAATTTREPCV